MAGIFTMFNFLKFAPIVVAAIILGIAFSLSPAFAQESFGTIVMDTSPTGELTYWKGIKDTNDVANFKTYLENFPNGMFYDVALAKFKSLGGNVTKLKNASRNGLVQTKSVKNLTATTSHSAKPKITVARKKSAPKLHKRHIANRAGKTPDHHSAKNIRKTPQFHPAQKTRLGDKLVNFKCRSGKALGGTCKVSLGRVGDNNYSKLRYGSRGGATGGAGGMTSLSSMQIQSVP